MFFRIWAFILCGCFLFETPLGRHFISTKLQTGQGFSEPVGFGHVEERSESVKSFSSKQSESSASDPGEDYDGGSFAGPNGNEKNNYLEYAGAESDQNEVGSGVVEDLREVEQADDNNVVNNVHDGSSGKYANEDGKQGGGTSYDMEEERLGGNIEDTSSEDSRSGVSLGNEKDLDNTAQQGEDSTNQRLKYDSSVKPRINQSVDGNLENLHSELSSHIGGPANDSYVTHVVESADDKEKTDDGEHGGNLPSGRINDSEVTHNVVEQSRGDVKADESVSRMSGNPSTDVVSHDEDATVGDDNNKEDKYQGLVTRKLGHVDVEGDENVKSNNDENPSSSTAANFVETSRDADQEVTNKRNLNPGVRAEMFAEESDPNAVGSKAKEVVHFTNVIEPDASAKGPAERDEEPLSKFNNHLEENEEESASRAKDMTTNVVTDTAEPKVGDEDRAEQDEESHAEPKDHPMLKSDWNGKDKSTENVAPSDVSETGDDTQASEEEESNSNSAQISNATVAQILKSSRVTKDMANEKEKMPASDESSQAVAEDEKDEQGTEYSSDNTAPHRAESDPEEGQEDDGQRETASERKEPLQGDTRKLAPKSRNEAIENETDPSDEKTEADGDNESNDAHGHGRAHDEESTEDDEDLESQIAQPPINEDQEGHEEEGSSSDGKKAQYRVPDDKVKSVHDEVSERKAEDPNNEHRTKAASTVTDGKSQKEDTEDKQEAFDDHTAASGAEPSGEGVKHENEPPSDEAQLKNHGGKMSEKLHKQAGQRVVESMDNDDDDDHDFHSDHVDNAHDDDNVQPVRDEDSAAEDEKQEENGKMNEEDQENTAKDEDPMTKDVGQQDETDSINSFLVEHGKMPIDNVDQAKQKKHTVESSASESPVKNPDVSIKEKTEEDGDWPDEQANDNGSSEEYDDVDLLSSGTSEPNLFDGNQLESASLISSKPGKEGRVARAKIYRPENHSSFLKGEDSPGSDSNPRQFTNYVADDGKEEQLQLEDDEQENAMGRDWLGERPVKVKDWGEGGLSGATRNSGLKNDYEKADGDKKKKGKIRNDKTYAKAAHKDLRHSKRTKKIFASLEKRLGKNKISPAKESSGLKFYAKLKGGKKKKGKKYTAAVHRAPNHFKKTQEILTSLENEIFNDGNKEGTSKSRRAKTHSHKRIHVKLHHKDHSREHKSYIDYSGLSPSSMISLQMFPVVAATPYTTPMALPKPQFTYHDLRDAQLKGAVCLDGSTPKFFFRKGFGDGLHNWIIYLQGGAWCETRESCLERSTTQLGSSRYVKDVDNPGGLLSADYKDNPAFFNWNVVYLPYCDGSSFAGNRSDPVRVEGDFLYFRGKRILSAAMDDLLIGGLQHAREVVLSGTSAGGLAVMLHADYIRSRLPNHVHLHSLADSGFFLDIPNRKGEAAFRKAMQNVFKLHDCTSGVDQKCVAEMSGKDLWKCIFPQYFLKFVQSPLYVVNPIFDSWQLENIYDVHCAYHVEKCTDEEKKEISKFGHATITALHSAVHRSSAVQMFADACVDHGQVISNLKWRKIKVKNLSISSAFTKWYRQTNRGSVVDDTQFLVNPTCV